MKKGIKGIRICDYSQYVPELSNNGGQYGFWTDYIQNAKGTFDVLYGTTADFTYCPYCGSFGNECGCEDPETVTLEELNRILKKFRPVDRECIEVLM